MREKLDHEHTDRMEPGGALPPYSDWNAEAAHRQRDHSDHTQGSRTYLQQAGEAASAPMERYPVVTLIAGAAVGYLLAWLIHSGRTPSERSTSTLGRQALRPLRDTGYRGPEDDDQPWPTGDSPKPHGDKLPNMVKLVPDYLDRY